MKPTLSRAVAALEFLAVVGAVALASWLVARGHTTSIWMDMEFTGWVAPIANRLGDGVRLYSEHRHSPMPPLPVLITRAVSGGSATWLTESLSIAVSQSVLVVVMYLALARIVPRPVPMVASLLSIPVYFALLKTISYDAITQALVALSAVAAVAVAGRGPSPGGPARRLAGPALCALMAAITILSKQSTGAGLALGVAAALALVGPLPWRARLARTAAYLVLTPALFLLLCLLILPWVDVRGMIRDVFLIGSEPKGGSGLIGYHLKNYAWTIAAQAVPFLAYGVAFAGLRRATRRPEDGPTPGPESFGGRTALAASTAAIAAPLALLVPLWRSDPWAFRLCQALLPTGGTLLWAGLMGLMLSALGRRPMAGAPADRTPSEGLAALFLVLFPSAIFHSLSVPEFRWTYDNNPLISVALAALVYALFALLLGDGPRRLGRLGAPAAVAGVLALSGVLWSTFAFRVLLVQGCTEEWPEVAYLKGARLRKSADGFRSLVATVRRLAPDPGKDAVLLLPNDPNVEAWFDRPRPDLSSLVVFTDQYWDRYVDRDFQALAQSPPRVIVIGPRDYWRAAQLVSNVNKGSERLIDLIRTRLLPEKYALQPPQAISFQGRLEFMDIYVLKDEPARSIAAAPATVK